MNNLKRYHYKKLIKYLKLDIEFRIVNIKDLLSLL